MIIYTKGWTVKDAIWTVKDAITSPLVFDTKDIFYVRELPSGRSKVVLRDGGGNLVELTVEASAKQLADKMDENWWELCGDVTVI